MKVIIVMGGYYYEGHAVHTMKIFSDTVKGKNAADDYSEQLKGTYDKVYYETEEVNNG